MKVLMISPGFPADMPYFTRALAEVGAKVIGVGDQHQSSLESEVSDVLSAYFQPTSLWDEDNTVNEVAALTGVSRNTVKDRLREGCRLLRALDD